MHPLFEKADKLSHEVIGGAIEVHRHKGPGLIESIYEKCLVRELALRGIPTVQQKLVRIEYKGLILTVLRPQSAASQLHEVVGYSGRPAHQLPRASPQERYFAFDPARRQSRRARTL